MRTSGIGRAVGQVAGFGLKAVGTTAEEGGEGGEAGADDADVEFDGADDEDGDDVPDVIVAADEDDAVVQGDDRAEAGAVT